MRNSFSLGAVAGIELRADFSWLFGMVLLVLALATGYLPMQYPNWSTVDVLVVSISIALFFSASIVAHELGHSLVSRKLGLPVPTIILFIFGGLAQLKHEPQRPRDEFLIASAGPLVSLVLAFGFGILVWVDPNSIGTPLVAFGRWLGMVNLGLALFNLLPGFPLDGGRILRAFIWHLTGSFETATKAAGINGRVIAFVLITWGVFQVIVGNWGNGLWIVFIGWFLDQSAYRYMTQAALEGTLRKYKTRDFLVTDCPRVEPLMKINKLVDDIALPSGRQCFLVEGGAQINGLISMEEVQLVPRNSWNETTVGAVMIPLWECQTVSLELDLFETYQQMLKNHADRLPVVENGQFEGIIKRSSILVCLKTHGIAPGKEYQL